MKIIPTKIVALALLTATSFLRAQQSPGAVKSDPEVYNETKTFLEIYGYATDMDSGLVQQRTKFLANGTQSIPSLIRLFNETENDYYRARVISLLRQMEGDKAAAIQLVETELAKDPRDWTRRTWLNMAVLLLHDTDINRARKAYVRILQVDENENALLMATTMLKQEGEPEDIAALERIIERRKGIPLAKGQTQDGVSFGANAAIQKIRERSQSTVLAIPSNDGVALQPTATVDASPAPGAAKSIADSKVGEEEPARSWWPWAVGGGLLLAVLVFFFNKSK